MILSGNVMRKEYHDALLYICSNGNSYQMIDQIRNEAQYNQVMASIEKFIVKATDNGGFNFLSAEEKEELGHLSALAERYEDNTLKIMSLVTDH
jgi:hypothetical protein